MSYFRAVVLGDAVLFEDMEGSWVGGKESCENNGK